MLKLDGVDFDASKSAIEAIANEAYKLGDGARGLRTIMESNLLDAMYSVPDGEIKKFTLDYSQQKMLLKYDKTQKIANNV